uniref:Uncharacterized protein n=1 Tax=Oryza glumipatula TaxID=40148 RepID=A0A0E0A7W0_9ORYZ
MRLHSLLHTLAAGGVLVVGLGVAGGSAVARRPPPLLFGDGRRWPLSRAGGVRLGIAIVTTAAVFAPCHGRVSAARRCCRSSDAELSRRELAMANGLWGALGQALRVAQLVGVDALGLVSMVVQAALAAHRWDACWRLGQHVELVGGLLWELELAELMWRDATRRPLERLHGAHPPMTRARSCCSPPAEGKKGRERERRERGRRKKEED